jgi:hypothetical protein
MADRKREDQTQEGVAMNLQEVRDKASALGIDHGGSTPKLVLIRAIQRHEGSTSCFGTDVRYACKNFQCPWHADCLKPIAEWMR